jgi:hypothetical protein
MANDSFKIKKGLNIEPNTAPNLSTDGDIGFNSTDSNLEVYTNGSVKKVITNSQTQTLTNKTLTAPTIDVMTLDGQASAPANPSAGNYKVYVDDTTSKLQILDSSGTVTTVGTSAGGINYITNGDAEAATTGWATYADAAGTSPVDGTGGTANVTFTRSTSSPLRGLGSFLITKDAVNRQGQGASYAFTIADADKAKTMQIDFELEVNSGTYVTGDVAVYIYDVTNAAVIQPSSYQVENVGIESRQRLTFQTASNSTSYRLCFHVASTSALAYALKVDTITLGPQVVPLGAPVTDWVSYTPTGSWSANTTYTGRWKRVGDNAEIQVKVATTGVPTSANLSVSLPSGLVIDTAKLLVNTLDEKLPSSSGNIFDNGTTFFDVDAYYLTTTTVLLKALDASATYARTISTVTQAIPMTWANGDNLMVSFSVPIVGWSSSTVVSSSADTRVVVARLTNASNITLAPNNSFVKVTGLDTKTFDTSGIADTSNSRMTAVTPGYYDVIGEIATSGVNTIDGTQYMLTVYKNGSLYQRGNIIECDTSDVFGITVQAKVQLNAGDYVELYLYGEGNNSASTITATQAMLACSLIQGPSQIAASEVIVVDAYGPTSVHNSSQADLTGWTEIHDTHGVFNPTTGVFTAPAPGYYRYEAAYGPQNTGTPCSIFVRKNSAAYTGTRRGSAYSNGSVYPTAQVFGTMWLNAGETINFQAQNSSVGTVSTDSQNTFLTIHRLGGVM